MMQLWLKFVEANKVLSKVILVIIAIIGLVTILYFKSTLPSSYDLDVNETAIELRNDLSLASLGAINNSDGFSKLSESTGIGKSVLISFANGTKDLGARDLVKISSALSVNYGMPPSRNLIFAVNPYKTYLAGVFALGGMLWTILFFALELNFETFAKTHHLAKNFEDSKDNKGILYGIKTSLENHQILVEMPDIFLKALKHHTVLAKNAFHNYDKKLLQNLVDNQGIEIEKSGCTIIKISADITDYVNIACSFLKETEESLLSTTYDPNLIEVLKLYHSPEGIRKLYKDDSKEQIKVNESNALSVWLEAVNEKAKSNKAFNVQRVLVLGTSERWPASIPYSDIESNDDLIAIHDNFEKKYLNINKEPLANISCYIYDLKDDQNIKFYGEYLIFDRKVMLRYNFNFKFLEIIFGKGITEFTKGFDTIFGRHYSLEAVKEDWKHKRLKAEKAWQASTKNSIGEAKNAITLAIDTIEAARNAIGSSDALAPDLMKALNLVEKAKTELEETIEIHMDNKAISSKKHADEATKTAQEIIDKLSSHEV